MFCQKCGKEIMDEAVVCGHCGCATDTEFGKAFKNRIEDKNELYNSYLNRYLSRLRNAGIIWLVMGVFQIAAAIFWLTSGLEYGESYALGAAVVIMGLFNLFISKTRFDKSRMEPGSNFVGEWEWSLKGYIWMIAVNIVAGALIGAIGVVYELSIRQYVLKNSEILNDCIKHRRENP